MPETGRDSPPDVFVVADAHGRLDLIEGLIAKSDARRGPGRLIVQLGDLCNCVSKSIRNDLACLEAAPDLFDVLLVGNHEHPYFGGPAFGGYWREVEVERKLLALDWQPSLAVGDTLITHAGVTPEMAAAEDTGDGGGTAEMDTAALADDQLRYAWSFNPKAPVFSQIGRQRGGWDEYGGILWSDWYEPKANAFTQVVGHTVGSDVRVKGDPPYAYCIDLGAAKGSDGYPDGDRIAGCWIREAGIEVVIYARDQEEAA